MESLIFIYFTFPSTVLFFFFNDTATTEIYTLSLHDALPIYVPVWSHLEHALEEIGVWPMPNRHEERVRLELVALARVDRKSTRLNSSHQIISYAVFCLKKKKEKFRSL